MSVRESEREGERARERERERKGERERESERERKRERRGGMERYVLTETTVFSRDLAEISVWYCQCREESSNL